MQGKNKFVPVHDMIAHRGVKEHFLSFLNLALDVGGW
jgi:hypothetical protein